MGMEWRNENDFISKQNRGVPVWVKFYGILIKASRFKFIWFTYIHKHQTRKRSRRHSTSRVETRDSFMELYKFFPKNKQTDLLPCFRSYVVSWKKIRDFIWCNFFIKRFFFLRIVYWFHAIRYIALINMINVRTFFINATTTTNSKEFLFSLPLKSSEHLLVIASLSVREWFNII